MFVTIHDDTADALWLRAAAWFHPDGIAKEQSSRAGTTREVLHAALSLGDPRQRWIASREPAMNPAFAIAEVIWIVNGRNDSAFLNYFNPRLPKFAGSGNIYHGAYGFRLCKSFGFDQMRQAVAALQCCPDNRQIVLQIWDGKIDLPHSDGKPQSPDIPCNIVALLKVRSGRLDWTQVMRSNDLFLGLPHNLVQFTTLQEVVAGRIGVKMGEYQHLSDSLHLYERDDYILQETPKQNCPLNNDRLDVSTEESEHAFQELAKQVELVTNSDVTSEALLTKLNALALPQSFINLLAIVVADGCRRRNKPEEAAEAIRLCDNSCLRFMWNRWVERILRSTPR